MGMYLVSTLLANAAVIMQDPTGVRWPPAELLAWLNEGQREIAAIKPNACVVNTVMPLVPGSKQTLPTTPFLAVSLTDVVRNMGNIAPPNSVAGTAIRAVSREILDAQVPDWHTAAKASAVVKHFIYNLLDPKTFYVYPPQLVTPTQYVEVVFLAIPTDTTALGTLTIDDIYAQALLNYVLFRAYSKDAEYAANATLAKAYLDLFMAQLGAKATAESITNPMLSLGAFNPNVPASGK